MKLELNVLCVNCGGPDVFMNSDSYIFEVRLKRYAITSEKGQNIRTSHRRMRLRSIALGQLQRIQSQLEEFSCD